jgi:3-hydroxybutyryl-CoA dehydrogenase
MILVGTMKAGKMHSINNVVIITAEESGARIQQLFSRADLQVTTINSKTSDADELAAADIAIEAIGEEGLRKKILHRCDERLRPEAILSTTVVSGMTELSAFTKRPQRFVGLHFTFNPFQDSCLVQIVKSLETSDETLEICTNLMEKTGATTIQVVDSPGLVLDRTMALTINEAATMYVTKVATIEDIDRIAKSCLNWPLGPFEFADVIGVDNVLATLETLAQEIGPQFLPCRLLKQMVATGRRGKATGRGFYIYH